MHTALGDVDGDGDPDPLVEGKTPDFSVSIQDTDPVDTMTIPTAVRVERFVPEAVPVVGTDRLILYAIGIVMGRVFLIKKATSRKT